jgi:hypothetical protein
VACVGVLCFAEFVCSEQGLMPGAFAPTGEYFSAAVADEAFFRFEKEGTNKGTKN